MDRRLFLFFGLLILACGPTVLTPPEPGPTSLPTLTPTPIFNRWDTVRVIRAMDAAGLAYENPHVMDPEEYGPIPALAAEAIRFSIPSACAGCVGIILKFDDPAALATTKATYNQASTAGNSALSAWVFEKDNILLHLSGALPEAEAMRYGAVLTRLRE